VSDTTITPDAMSSLRAKYPQYSSIGDADLAQRIITKYPQYQSALGKYTSEAIPAATSPKPPAPLDPKAVDKFRSDYFNTLNANANIPIQTAHALAKNPNDADSVQRLSQMSPIAQAAIRQKAHEIATEPVYDETPHGYGAYMQAPIYHDPQTGARTSMPLPSQIIGTMLHGPEGYNQLQQAQGAIPEITRMAEGTFDPQNLLFLAGAGALGATGKIGSTLVKAGIAGMMGTNAVQRAKGGDYGGAAVDAALGLLPFAHNIGKATDSVYSKAVNDALRYDTSTPSVHPLDPTLDNALNATHVLNGNQLLTESESAPLPTSAPIERTGGIHPDSVTSNAVNGFTKAADLFTDAKAANPALTKPEFAQQLYDFHKANGDQFNYEGPTGNAKPRDVFTAKADDGRPIRYFGFSEKASYVLPVEPTPPLPTYTDTNTGLPVDVPLNPDGTPQTRYKNLPPGYEGRSARIVQTTDPNRIPAKLLQEDITQTLEPVQSDQHALGVAADGLTQPEPNYSQNQTQSKPASEPGYTEHLPSEDIGNGSGQNLSKPVDAIRQVFDKVRNTFYENGSGLRRERPATFQAAIETASAPQIAKVETAIRTPQVLEGMTPDNQARFARFLIADRIVNHGDMLKAAFDTADKSGKNEITQKLKNLAVGRANDPLLDPVSGKPITEQNLRDFFAEPEVQKAVNAHNQHVGSLMDSLFQEAGYSANPVRGKYSGAFMPGIATALDGETSVGGGGRDFQRAKLQQSQMSSAQEFGGSGQSYEPDYAKAVESTLSNRYRVVNERKFVRQALADGLFVDADNPGDKLGTIPGGKAGEVTPSIEFNGAQEPSTKVNLGQTFGLRPDEANTLPTNVIMPSRFVNELAPLNDAVVKDTIDRVAQKIQSSVFGVYLNSPGDTVSHASSLSSRMSNVLPMSKNPIANAVLKNIPYLKGVWFIKDLFPRSTPEYAAQKVEALRAMARNGKLPTDYGKNMKLQVFAKALNGVNGAVTNAATAMYGYVDEMPGGAKSESGQKLLNQMYDQLNSTIPMTRSGLQKVSSAASMGSFYQTGVKNRMSAFNQPGKAPLTIATTLIVATLADVTLKMALAKQFDPQHRNATEIPGYNLGNIHVGENSDGSAQYINLNALDKTQAYTEFWVKSIVKSISKQDDYKQMVGNLIAETGNQVLAPVMTGPAVNTGETLLGSTPHFSLDENGSGFNWRVQNPADTATPQDRAGMLLQGLVPQTSVIGDLRQGSRAPNTPAAEWYNRAAGLTGLPQVTSSAKEQDTLKRDALQRRRSDEIDSGTFGRARIR
jgi:hypothetical protein